MGMAASQARLLTLTARLADNELRSQTINNAKMRLAAQSAQASDEYVRALNEAQLMFRNTDLNGLSQNQALNFNVLSAYSPYNTQYGVVNSAGLLLVSEADAKNFEAAKGDLDTFLKNYGIGWETSYFGITGEDLDSKSISNDLKSVYPDFEALFNKDNREMKSLYENYNANRFSIENAQYKNVSQSYASELNFLSAKYLNECYNRQFDNTSPEDYAASMLTNISDASSAKTAVSGLIDKETYVTNEGRATLAFMRNSISDYVINNQKYVGYVKSATNLNNQINVSLKTVGTTTYRSETKLTVSVTTTTSQGTIVEDVECKPTTTETSTKTTGTTYDTIPVTTTVVDDNGKPKTVPVTTTTVDDDGNTISVPVTTLVPRYNTEKVTTYIYDVPIYDEMLTFNIGDLVIELDEDAFKTVETTTNGVTQTTYTTDLKDNISYEDIKVKGIQVKSNDYYLNDTPLDSGINLGSMTLFELINGIYQANKYSHINEQGETIDVIKGYTKFALSNVSYIRDEGIDENGDYIQKNASEYKFGTVYLNPETEDNNIYENFLIDYINYFKNKNYFNQEKYADANGENSDVLAAKQNFENFVFNQGIEISSWTGDEVLDLQKFFSKEVNVKVGEEYFSGSLLKFYTGSVKDSSEQQQTIEIFTQEFRNVINAKLIEMMIEELGEPKYTWNDSQDLSNKGNADTKAQWYTNLFNRMLKGYKTLENGLASSKEWLQHAFESGLISMEQVDTSYNWKGIDYKNCASITEETDNSAAVARAEAKYKRAMNDIKQKDNIFDLQLRNLDTEHSAIQTEYDVVKNVMNKNIERTMKFNQSA